MRKSLERGKAEYRKRGGFESAGGGWESSGGSDVSSGVGR
jgi:hypothetical protein